MKTIAEMERGSKEIQKAIDKVDNAIINLEKISEKYDAKGTLVWTVSN